MNDRRLTLRTLTAALLAAGGGVGRAKAGSPSPPPASPSPNPARWTRQPDMPLGLAKFGAAAVGTRVVTAGGYDTLRTVLLFDTVAGTWVSGSPLLAGTDNVAVLAVGGRVHTIGGEARTAQQIYDAAAGVWSAGPPSPRIRFASAAAVLNGRLHLIGGWNYDNAVSASVASHDVYDPLAGTWTAAAPLATARNAAAAAVLDGRIVVVGGRAPGIRASDQTSLATCEVYDPSADRWSAGPPLPQARAGLAVVALGGDLYALGGESTPGGLSAAVTRLDSVGGTWTVLDQMPWAAHGLAAAVVGEVAYVMGGFTQPSDAAGTETRQCWRFAPGSA